MSWAYVVVVLAAVVAGCWRRRDSLSVYNVHPSAVPHIVADAAAAVGLSAEAGPIRLSRPLLGHVEATVRRLEPAARRDLLGELRTGFAAAPTAGGVASGWWTGLAAVLIGASFALIGASLRLTRTI